MRITEDAWLSDVLGQNAFRVEVDDGSCVSLSRPASGFYYVKVPTARIDHVRQFGQAGFYVVDVNVSFSAAARTFRPPSALAAVAVSEVLPTEAGQVLDIAESSFTYSRFHLDPQFPRGAANRIKREWIASYLQRRRGDRLFVARIDGRPVGFLAALSADDGTARVRVIDLVGVAASHRRQGIGRALVAAFARHYRDGSDRFQVGTQAANLPSLGFYQTQGFSIAGMTYVMHLHV